MNKFDFHRYIFVSLWIFFIAIGRIQASDTISEADSLYAAEQYHTAIEHYTKAMKDDGTSSELYYNLGNAYYRNGNLGKAVVCYERSLRIDPTNDDALQNLQFVRTKLADKPGVSGTFFSNAYDSTATVLTSNTWATISFIIFALVACGICLYFFSNKVLLRKFGFFGSITLFVCMIICIAMSLRSYNISTATDKAVIIVPSTILSTSPRTPKDRNEEAMLLHEGTLVTIIDSVTSGSGRQALKWYEVDIDNRHRAWIKKSDIEMI